MHGSLPPPEDLFREHAVLRRILIVFDECARITRVGGRYDARIVAHAAQIFATFGAAYHAKSEERFIFPLFRVTDLAVVVENLRREHAVATQYVQRIAALAQQNNQPGLAETMPAFTWLYRRHAAHEDIVVFANLRDIFSTSRDFHELGERMEEFEHRTLGPDGFVVALEQLAEIERPLGLDTATMYGRPPR